MPWRRRNSPWSCDSREVIAGEVGEGGSGEGDACGASLIEGVAGDFHGEARQPLSRIEPSRPARSVADGVVMVASWRVRPSSISTVPTMPQRLRMVERMWRMR